MVSELKIITQDFARFLRSPDLAADETSSFRRRLGVFVVVVVLTLFFTGLSGWALYALEQAGMINSQHHAVEEWFKNLSLASALLWGAFIAPIFEEIVSRSWLRYSAGAVGFVLTLLIIALGSWAGITAGGSPAVTLGIVVLCLVFLFSLPAIFARYQERLTEFWARRFAVVYYASVLIFGFAHLSNWDLQASHNLAFAPVLVLPQLIAALSLGYLRIRFGMGWNMGLHVLVNTLGIAASFLSPGQP